MLGELKLTVETSCVESSGFQLDYMLELPGGFKKIPGSWSFSLSFLIRLVWGGAWAMVSFSLFLLFR